MVSIEPLLVQKNMKLTKNEQLLLEGGLSRATRNEHKWQVVLALIVPKLIGERLYKTGISYRDQSIYTLQEEIAEVVLCKDLLVLTREKFWEKHQYYKGSLCQVGSFSFSFVHHRPLLDGNKLILGALSGWGNEPWYLKINPLDVVGS